MYRIETLNGNKWLHTTMVGPPHSAADHEKALALRYSQNQGQLESLKDARALIPVIMGLIKTRGCIRVVDGDGNVCA